MSSPSSIEFRPWELPDNDLMVEWVREDPGIIEAMRLPAETTEFRIRELLTAGMSAPDIWWFVAERDGQPVGAVGATHIQRDGSAVCHIIVPKEHQNSILAMRIGKAAIKFAFETLGFKEILGLVPEENKRALRFDKHLGFRDIHLRSVQLTRDEYLKGIN